MRSSAANLTTTTKTIERRDHDRKCPIRVVDVDDERLGSDAEDAPGGKRPRTPLYAQVDLRLIRSPRPETKLLGRWWIGLTSETQPPGAGTSGLFLIAAKYDLVVSGDHVGIAALPQVMSRQGERLLARGVPCGRKIFLN